jgi:hypothetical protein
MKKCSKCLESKQLNEFPKRKNKHHCWCKPCNKTYHQNYWKTSPERRKIIKSNLAELRKEIHTKIIDYLVTHPCTHCGENNLLTLEFDHLHDKKFNISHAIKRVYGWDKIKAEIDKCQVLCANCHAIKTAKDNNNWKLEWLARSESNGHPTD